MFSSLNCQISFNLWKHIGHTWSGWVIREQSSWWRSSNDTNMEPSRIPESITPWGASTIMIKKTTVEFIYEWSKKTPIILTARMSPFRNYRISKDYRNPSYIRSFHNYDQINHNWIHLRMAENTSHHVNCTDVTLPQLWISTDYRNPSYHGSFHNYDHYEWPKRTLII